MLYLLLKYVVHFEWCWDYSIMFDRVKKFYTIPQTITIFGFYCVQLPNSIEPVNCLIEIKITGSIVLDYWTVRLVSLGRNYAGIYCLKPGKKAWEINFTSVRKLWICLFPAEIEFNTTAKQMKNSIFAQLKLKCNQHVNWLNTFYGRTNYMLLSWA